MTLIVEIAFAIVLAHWIIEWFEGTKK